MVSHVVYHGDAIGEGRIFPPLPAEFRLYERYCFFASSISTLKSASLDVQCLSKASVSMYTNASATL